MNTSFTIAATIAAAVIAFGGSAYAQDTGGDATAAPAGQNTDKQGGLFSQRNKIEEVVVHSEKKEESRQVV